jgi:putative ABC transport system ATP-binding protein
MTAPTTLTAAPDPSEERSAAHHPVIELTDVTKRYGSDENSVVALDRVTLSVARGDHVAIMGTSGSGKSTLMNIIGCLDEPSSGTYRLDGRLVGSLSPNEVAALRNRHLGFVFQSFNLLRRTSALVNVELPLVYARVGRSERRARATAALASVGLADRLDHGPSQLSGGQQQRVAIARAIVSEPSLILADEPTGALDSSSTSDVLDIFDDLNRAGRTVVVITHEEEVAARAKRVIRLIDGRIVEDVRQGMIPCPQGQPTMGGRSC